jgi:hypothetical protein
VTPTSPDISLPLSSRSAPVELDHRGDCRIRGRRLLGHQLGDAFSWTPPFIIGRVPGRQIPANFPYRCKNAKGGELAHEPKEFAGVRGSGEALVREPFDAVDFRRPAG